MGKSLFKKSMALALGFALALTITKAPAYAAPKIDDTFEKSLLFENFDKVESYEGQSVFGWNEWGYWKQYNNNTEDDSDYTITNEPDVPSNKVASLHRPNGLADTTMNKFMQKSLSEPVSSGRLSVRFRLRAENEESQYFQIRFFDDKYSANLQFQVAFPSSTIGDIKENGRLYRFGGAVSNTQAELEKWFLFEILLDMDSRSITYFENGTRLGEPAPMHPSFESGVIHNILIGTHRVNPAGGLFYFDDLTVALYKGASKANAGEVRFYKSDPNGKVEITQIGLLSGNISAAVDVANDSGTDESMLLVMGLYSGDVLEKTTVSRFNVSAGETKTEEISILVDNFVKGKHLRLFLWDEKLSPVISCPPFYAGQGKIYYVSPNGNDRNIGSFEAPWKTIYKAAQTVQAGSLVILEDGEYFEVGPTTFLNSGTEGAPIIYRARNRHGAKLVYPESVRLTSKMAIVPGQSHITIEGLYFTQLSMANDDDANKTADIFLACRGTDCSFIGNRFERAYEEGIKLSRGAERILIDGNIITQMNHEGIDSLNSFNVIIRNNHITEVGRVGIMVKGGARNNVVYNNYISNRERSLGTAAITVGGSTNNTSPYDIREGTGFEAYSSVFYNNIIYSEVPGLIMVGLYYMGAKDCTSFNNVVVGARYAMAFRSTGGMVNGWEWDPPNVNPVLRNNIFANCTSNVFQFVHVPQNLSSDYNLYYNALNLPTEANSIYADPLFEETGANWRLRDTSPAKGGGYALPSEMTGFEGSRYYIELVDFEGVPRTEPWNMGAY